MAYSLGITDVDPLKYQLLFERFLNEKRAQMPDIDIDLPDNRRDEVISHLKKQYEKVVISNLKITLSQISNNRINGESKINELISQKEEDYVVKLGLFVDKYSLIDKYVIDDIADATKLLCSYNDLMIDDKKELKFLMEIISRKCVLLIAAECRKSNEASFLYHVMEEFALWIDLTTKLKIRELVNVKFSLLNNVEELSYAYEGGFISEEQYLVRYITLTKDFTIEQFLEAIRKDFYKDIPILIQEYIIREVIRKFDFTELSSDAYVKLNYNVIHNMEELIQWFNEQSDIYLDKSLWNTIKEEMVSRLNKENRWYLFEKDLIESPSKEIIREKLEQAYLMYKFSGDYINKDCFQKIMQEDVLREKKDYKKISLILDSLNDIYKDDILENGDDFHRFYVWVEKPKEITDRRLTQIINWDTISRYYALLPDKLQVRLLKYLFYLKAFHKIDFSINDFYVMLMTNSIGRVNSTLQLICFILLEKSKSLSTIIKGEIKSREADIDILKDLFYECDGLLLKGQFDDFPFIDGSIRKEGDYFVISLHDYLGDASYVKAVLTQNLPCKLINGEYWISTNLELEVKDFVVSYGIKDQCQLFKKQHLSQRANVKYRERNLMLCKCGKCLDVDPEFGLPFYWCRKKVCTHSGRYLVPLFDWEEYKFVDLLNILYGNDLSLREKIWNVNAEISQFLIYGSNSNHEILGYFYKSKKKNSHYIRYESERGVWTEDMSIITDVNLDEEVYDDYDDYDEDDIYYCNKDDEDEDEYNGYGRYAGSYAQDEMGYSDDDIDTIFDGDPDAYWNID